MSTKLFHDFENFSPTLVLYKNGAIFAAGYNRCRLQEGDPLMILVELNLFLDVVKKLEGRGDIIDAIDANENYVAVSYSSDFVDVYSRKELEQNGTCKKIMVCELLLGMQL